MSEDEDRDLGRECREARPWLDERMDRALEPDTVARLEAHLATCPDCREYAAGLDEVRRAFGGLPAVAFPDESLHAVLAATVDREPWWSRVIGSASALRPVLAGASAVLLAAVALWVALSGGPRPTAPPMPPSPTDAELERAAVEARYALTIVRGAMARTGRAVVHDVLEDAIVPAFDRVPLRFPDGGTGKEGA